MAKHPCGCCGKPVKKKQKALLCTNCSLWVHISCGRVPKHHYDDANESFINWECPKCLFCHLPFESEESLNLDTEDNGVNSLMKLTKTYLFQIVMSQNSQITKV